MPNQQKRNNDLSESDRLLEDRVEVIVQTLRRSNQIEDIGIDSNFDETRTSETVYVRVLGCYYRMVIYPTSVSNVPEELERS